MDYYATIINTSPKTSDCTALLARCYDYSVIAKTNARKNNMKFFHFGTANWYEVNQVNIDENKKQLIIFKS